MFNHTLDFKNFIINYLKHINLNLQKSVFTKKTNVKTDTATVKPLQSVPLQHHLQSNALKSLWKQ